ncbi:MAG: tetratricopeptide repeat protein [bacterium]|nr:tetratricopeptide repeat protein [bacterium]
MKKSLIPILFAAMLFLSGCNLNLSNLDVQKLNNAAAEYMKAGEFDKAASRLEAITELNPDLPETYYNLGIAYYQMEEYDKAVRAFSDAIIRKPIMADAYYSRAIAHEDLAYSILDGNGKDENYKPTEEDSNLATEYLQNAKADFENYLKCKKDADDTQEVMEKISQIEQKLNGDTQEAE